jgi:hypothetical protein
MSDKEDTLRRTYSQLISLRNNLPSDHPDNKMEWDNVNLYNELIQKLETIGFNVNDFKIPESMLTNERVESNYVTHETVESGRSNVRHGFLKTKLDSILTYFQLGTQKTRFGFRDPDEEE